MDFLYYKTQIENQFQEYLDSLYKKEFEKALEYLDSDLFEFVSKSEMLDEFTEYYDNPNVSLALENAKIINVSDLIEVNHKSYSFVDYKLVFHLILNPIEGESKSKLAERTQLSKPLFSEIFGVENLEYVGELDFFRATSYERAIAIKKPKSRYWKFLVYDEEEMIFLNKLIPQEIMIELNQHLSN